MKSHPANPAKPLQDPPAPIPAIPPGVTLVTMENGLTLIIGEDRSAPVVSAQAWCRAGSIDEAQWLGGGLSHVLEHMLFKGTATRPTGRIAQEVQDAGGYMNAYTSFDRTVYWINVPNTGAEVALDILCDIMQNASLPEQEMEKEKQVILREMDMSHDDPEQRSSRRLFETAYIKSPYRFPIIGCPDIFSQVRREDVLAYYHEKYPPNNLFFVVVGHLNPVEVENQIRTAFANAKARPVPPTVPVAEPPQTAPRDVIEEAAIELGHLHFCWHIPGLHHPDAPLLDALATLLGAGRSSRLYQRVREKKGLVNAIDAWIYNPAHSGLIGTSAVSNAEQFTAACQAMLEEIDRVKESPASHAEFAKVIKQFTAATLANRKTMLGQAQDLGNNWIATGDLSFSLRYLETVKRAGPDDLQRVARQYMSEENRTLYALVPAGSRPRKITTAAAAIDLPVQKFDLPNGFRLLVKEDHRLPFVEMRALFKGGVLAETQSENGLTLLMSKMLLQGTATQSAERIASAIESVGGGIESYAGNNSFGISIEVLRDDIEVGLSVLADVLLHPAFPMDSLERERQIQLAFIRGQRDELLASAFRLMRQGLFGNAGYGMLSIGTESSVQRLHTSDLQRFHQRLVQPRNGLLAVFGDVQSKSVLRAVTALLGRWPSGPAALDHIHPPTPRTQSKRLCEMRDKKQAVLVMGFPGCTLHSPDRYALDLIGEACSDLGSRLFLRIRDRLGLAYYVGAQNMAGLIPGFIAFYAGTAPEKVALVEKELARETRILRTQGLTPEELKRAKAKIIGQRKIARQDLGAHAASIGLDELYGLGFQHHHNEDAQYEAVTLEAVRQAAARHFLPQACTVSILTPRQPPPNPSARPAKSPLRTPKIIASHDPNRRSPVKSRKTAKKRSR